MIRSGAGDFFTDLSLVLAGRRTGGTAKAAVVSSGIYGSLTGSTTANLIQGGIHSDQAAFRYADQIA
ncbi:MAG: TRAP transporter large permease subunit [Alphaproteobacteria bacterium]